MLPVPAVLEVSKGLFIPTGKPAASPAEFKAAMEASLLAPFECRDPEDPYFKFNGQSKFIVGMARLADDFAAGLPSARADIFDRMLGKPTQNVQTISIGTTLKEFLATLNTVSAEPSVVEEDPLS